MLLKLMEYFKKSPVQNMALPLLGLCVYCLLVWHLPTSVYWRDSGEFLLGVSFLDVVHTSGFPLFLQLGNLISQIPIGPIAFRVHLFSTLILLTAGGLYSLVCGRYFFIPRSIIVLTLVSLCTSFSVLHMGLSAEVYMLSAVLHLFLLSLYAEYLRTRDVRWMYALGFSAGIAVANHLSIVLFLFTGILLLCIDRQVHKKNLVIAILWSFSAFALYTYLPIRAAKNPPLNTTAVTTLDAFYRYATLARDRELKAAYVNPQKKDGLIAQGIKDAARYYEELSLTFLFFAALGVMLIVVQQRALGLLIVSGIVANWWFFKGWDPDPWVVAFILLALCGAKAVHALLTSTQQRVAQGILALLVIVGFLIPGRISNAYHSLAQIKNDDRAREVMAQKMSHVNFAAPFIVENGWLLSRYLKDIEGYRSDISLLYQPRILFPGYFEPFSISYENKRVFSNSAERSQRSREANIQLLAQALQVLARYGDVFVEPNISLNAFLKEALLLEPVGIARISFGVTADVNSPIAQVVSSFYRKNLEGVFDATLGADAKHFLSLELLNVVDLLARRSQNREAIKLLDEVCATPQGAWLCDPGLLKTKDELQKRL